MMKCIRREVYKRLTTKKSALHARSVPVRPDHRKNAAQTTKVLKIIKMGHEISQWNKPNFQISISVIFSNLFITVSIPANSSKIQPRNPVLPFRTKILQSVLFRKRVIGRFFKTNCPRLISLDSRIKRSRESVASAWIQWNSGKNASEHQNLPHQKRIPKTVEISKLFGKRSCHDSKSLPLHETQRTDRLFHGKRG